MPKILFKRLAVKEEERIIAGNNSSHNTVMPVSDRACFGSVPVASVNTCDEPIEIGIKSGNIVTKRR